MERKPQQKGQQAQESTRRPGNPGDVDRQPPPKERQRDDDDRQASNRPPNRSQK